MAGGAKQRKKTSAGDGLGTSTPSTTSYQPQTAFPPAAISEESENSSQAGRNRSHAKRA